MKEAIKTADVLIKNGRIEKIIATDFTRLTQILLKSMVKENIYSRALLMTRYIFVNRA